MSILRPESFKDWQESLKQIGHDDVNASVIPQHIATECANSPHRLEQIAMLVAKFASPLYYANLRVEPVSEGGFGLHYDVQGNVAELSCWFNLDGQAQWHLKSGGSRNRAELNEAMDDVGLETSHSIAGSGTVVDLRKISEFDTIEFSGAGGLVFAAGLQDGGDRIPAMHQVTGSPDRVSIAAYARRNP